MSVLITEHQRKVLITESLSDDFAETIKKNYQMASEILKESKEQMGLNLQFMMTWGASIGGFVGPLTDFIEGRFPELNSIQVTSILIGIISTFYLDNKKIKIHHHLHHLSYHPLPQLLMPFGKVVLFPSY